MLKGNQANVHCTQTAKLNAESAANKLYSTLQYMFFFPVIILIIVRLCKN